MSRRLMLILTCVFGLSVLTAAQSKNITNADLEKYKEKRLQSEREYRENYEKLGMPSPEELAKQDEQKRRENAELAARLRTERLQEERDQAEREQAEAAAQYNNSQTPFVIQGGNYNGSYLPYNYYPFGYNRRGYNRRGSYNLPRSGYSYGSGGFYYYNNNRYGNQLPPIRPPRPIQPPVIISPNVYSRGRH